jgi:hypothetical protein
MRALLDAWCDRRALAPLRIVLPHYPMPNGFSEELDDLVRALRTVRAQIGAALPTTEFDQLVSLLHTAENALHKTTGNV